MSFCSPRCKAFSHKLQDIVWVVLAFGILCLVVFCFYQAATMKPLVLVPRWRGPETKRVADLKVKTTSRLCKELGLPKPLLKLPKEHQR